MTAAIRAIFQWWGRALEWWRTFRANQSEALEPLLVTNDPQAATKCQRRQVIRFTPWAVRQVREVLNHHPTACVRANILGDNATGFRYEMKLDEAIRYGDLVDDSYGFYLVMDERSAGYLEGATVDFMVDGLSKAGFVFHNPNALRGLDAAESVPLE